MAWSVWDGVGAVRAGVDRRSGPKIRRMSDGRPNKMAYIPPALGTAVSMNSKDCLEHQLELNL